MYRTELFNELQVLNKRSAVTLSILTDFIILGEVRSENTFYQVRFLLDSLTSSQFKHERKNNLLLLHYPGINLILDLSSLSNGVTKGYYNTKPVTFNYEVYNGLFSLMLYGECVGVYVIHDIFQED